MGILMVTPQCRGGSPAKVWGSWLGADDLLHMHEASALVALTVLA